MTIIPCRGHATEPEPIMGIPVRTVKLACQHCQRFEAPVPLGGKLAAAPELNDQTCPEQVPWVKRPEFREEPQPYTSRRRKAR